MNSKQAANEGNNYGKSRYFKITSTRSDAAPSCLFLIPSQWGKGDTPGIQCTRGTLCEYRRFACKFFSDFNASESRRSGTAIGV